MGAFDLDNEVMSLKRRVAALLQSRESDAAKMVRLEVLVNDMLARSVSHETPARGPGRPRKVA